MVQIIVTTSKGFSKQIDEPFQICNKYKPWKKPPREGYDVLRLAGQIQSDDAFRSFYSFFKNAVLEVEKYPSKLAMDVNFIGRLEAT